MKHFHKLSIGSLILILLLFLFVGGRSMLAATNPVNIMVLPGAPMNAVVNHTTTAQVSLEWDPSPSPASDIASYMVFFKPVAEPAYPITPQFTITDSLSHYIQSIPVTPGVAYDFIIFANSVGGILSPSNCASCHVVNVPWCGNSLIDLGEDCDGTNLNGKSCIDYGYNAGTLLCSATCTFDSSRCYTAGGGGGPPVDSIPPNPGIASSPAYTNSSPITVTYAGASDTGGSGFSYVELMSKKGTGSWINTGLTSSSTSGSFDFIPDAGTDVTYYFDLRAFDNQGNQSSDPTPTGDTRTIYDIQAPTIGKITIPTSANITPIIINFENAVDIGIAGLDRVELWYKKGADGTWTDSSLTSTGANGAFNFSDVSGSDYYYFDLIAVDKAGNRSLEDAETKIPTLFDNEAPVLGSVTVPSTSNTSPIVITYTGAVDVGPAGLKKVELWYKKEIGGTWADSGLTNVTASGTFSFVPSSGSGAYYFAFVQEDKVGNRSAEASGNGLANTTYNPITVTVILSNLPAAVIEVGSVNIKVGGEGVTAYKYKLNENPYGFETPVSTNIALTDLPEGNYQLSVIGKHSSGLWQSISSPTTASWSVKFPIVIPPAEEPPPPAEEPPPPAEEPPPPAEEPPPPAEGGIPSVPGPGVPTGGAPTEALPPAEEPSLPAEEYSPIPAEIPPAITPPAPAVRYSAAEIEEIAVNIITKAPKLPAIPVTIVLPKTEQAVLDRIDECKTQYPDINFDQAALDSDEDGLSNKTECYNGTDPSNPDTDNDLCLDGDEINLFITDPSNSEDCRLEEKKKVISISSPQSGWLLAELQVTGLTPDNTSQVNLMAFPVSDGLVLLDKPVELGTISQFNPSAVEGQYFFKSVPGVQLEDGNTYELIAVGVLTDGQTISSAPVRFMIDSKKATTPPTPVSINDVPITDELKLSNIRVQTSKDGKVEVRGETEYGAQVFALWESLVLASSIVADSALGEFSMQSPEALETGQNHIVTLYAVKELDGQRARSKDVKINFYLEKPSKLPLGVIITFLIILLISIPLAIYLNRVINNRKRLRKK